jgi:hypothetical protein
LASSGEFQGTFITGVSPATDDEPREGPIPAAVPGQGRGADTTKRDAYNVVPERFRHRLMQAQEESRFGCCGLPLIVSTWREVLHTGSFCVRCLSLSRISVGNIVKHSCNLNEYLPIEPVRLSEGRSFLDLLRTALFRQFLRMIVCRPPLGITGIPHDDAPLTTSSDC